MKSNIRAKGILNIKLVNKKTGELEYNEKLENELHSGFASGVCGELTGESGVYVGKIDHVDLKDSGGSLIKTLTPPSTLEHLTYSDHDEAHAVFEDASTDEYTVGQVFMVSVYNSTNRTIAFKQGLNVSKSADQKLIVDWTIAVYFSVPS